MSMVMHGIQSHRDFSLPNAVMKCLKSHRHRRRRRPLPLCHTSEQAFPCSRVRLRGSLQRRVHSDLTIDI